MPIVSAMTKMPGTPASAFAAICLAVASAAAAETNTALFSERFERGLAGRWQPVKFGSPTDYTIVNDSTNAYLRAVANKSCSALMTELSLKPSGRSIVRWQWKIDGVPTNGTDRVAGSFDHAARIIIAFDTLIGPPRTVNYVWANREKVGVTLPHPLSGRAQMIVLQSGNERVGEWIAEERNIAEDWRRLFGGKTVPKITAIGVITDSENTGTHVTAYYKNIEVRSD
jgi:hypothetical protein